MMMPIVEGALGVVLKGLERGLEEMEFGGKNFDHPDDSIVELGQNKTGKSPGNPRKLVVAQNSVKNHQETVV